MSAWVMSRSGVLPPGQHDDIEQGAVPGAGLGLESAFESNQGSATVPKVTATPVWVGVAAGGQRGGDPADVLRASALRSNALAVPGRRGPPSGPASGVPAMAGGGHQGRCACRAFRRCTSNRGRA